MTTRELAPVSFLPHIDYTVSSVVGGWSYAYPEMKGL